MITGEEEKFKESCLEIEKKNKELFYRIDKLRQFNLDQTQGNQKNTQSDFEERLGEVRSQVIATKQSFKQMKHVRETELTQQANIHFDKLVKT